MQIPLKHNIDTDGLPEWGPHVDILLDGVVQTGVISFDCDACTICRNKTTENGHYIIDGEEILREQLHGEVIVQWKSKD
jgi:hypothetical protein